MASVQSLHSYVHRETIWEVVMDYIPTRSSIQDSSVTVVKRSLAIRRVTAMLISLS